MKVKEKKLLVTGGTGLVGSKISMFLLNAGYQVRIFTREMPVLLNDKIEYFVGDICSKEQVHEALIGCYGVYHCAGEKIIEQQMYATNVVGTSNIFEAATDLEVSFFCHISSVGVFGKTKLAIIDENCACNPMNEYESTKLMAEDVVKNGIGEGKTIILRPTNIFSHEIRFKYAQTSLKTKFKMWLKYKENANLVYIDDVAAAAIFFLNTQTPLSCETFIISSDQEPNNTIGKIKNTITELLGSKSRIPFFKVPLFVPMFIRILRHGKTNKGNITYSSSKLFSIGFQMPNGFLKGLRKICDPNREFYESI